MQRLWRLWFLVAVLIGCAYIGWFGSQYPYAAALPLFAIAAYVLLFLHPNSVVRRQVHGGLRLVVLGYALGAFIFIYNPFNLSSWLRNSTLLLRAEVAPVQTYDERTSRVILTDRERQAKQQLLTGSGFHWSLPTPLPHPLLVSFEAGLALVHGTGSIHFLTPNGVWLTSLSPLADGSFTYTKGYMGGDLNRARIRDGVLERIWTNLAPGLSIHHWGDDFDGIIYQPTRHFVDLPNELSTALGAPFADCNRQNASIDRLHLFDVDDGTVQGVIDVLPAILRLSATDDTLAKRLTQCGDPLHLNDVQILKTAREANFFPDGKIGDILISLRHLNAIFLMDRKTHDIKWYAARDFRLQHAPRITDHGTIILFDNFGSDAANGRSRIVEIDIRTTELVGVWEATGDDFFQAGRRGKVTLLGDTVLVQDQEGIEGHDNHMFLLHCPGGRISLSCRKEEVFEGAAPHYQYDNAFFLEGVDWPSE